MTAVEFLEKELYERFHLSYLVLFNELIQQAKEMEKEQGGYSKEDVREMLFMALNEPKETCCTTHTQDSIVRKVLKTFKSE